MPTSQRPWWKRTRWIAVLVLWLLAVSPLYAPAIMYLYMEGWLPAWAYRWAYWYYDVTDAALQGTPLGDLYWDYFCWWFPPIT